MPQPAWNKTNLDNPHSAPDKAQRVEQMFSAIAPRYDLNNRLHSLGQDQHWRKVAVKIADVKPDSRIVDVACGTGDLSLCFAKKLKKVTKHNANSHPVIGIDFTYPMLAFAKQKTEKKQRGAAVVLDNACRPGADDRRDNHPTRSNAEPEDLTQTNDTRPTASSAEALWINGDAQNLPLPDSCCDIVSIAFGIRNVAEPAQAIGEFKRILRPGGRLIILEFTTPTLPLLGTLYKLYSQHIMPHTASWISHDKSGAYKYLPKSVSTFTDKKGMISLLEQAGFDPISAKSMSLGAVTCYCGAKSIAA